jgi:hypothetical protein
LPPLGAQTPASKIWRINWSGTGSGLSRRIDRVVRNDLEQIGGVWDFLGHGILAHVLSARAQADAEV